jgi:hypothetical protein
MHRGTHFGEFRRDLSIDSNSLFFRFHGILARLELRIAESNNRADVAESEQQSWMLMWLLLRC